MTTPQHKSQPTMVSVTTRNTTETRPINLETYEQQDLMDLWIHCVIKLIIERKNANPRNRCRLHRVFPVGVGNSRCLISWQNTLSCAGYYYEELSRARQARSEAPWVRKFGYSRKLCLTNLKAQGIEKLCFTGHLCNDELTAVKIGYDYIVGSGAKLIEVTCFFKVLRWPVMVFKWSQAQEKNF